MAGTAGGPKCDHRHINLTAAGPNLRPGDVSVIGLRSRFGFLSPKSGEIYALDPDLPAEFQTIRATIQSSPDLDLMIVSQNGREIARRKVENSSKATVLVNLHRGRQLLEVAGVKDGRAVRHDQAEFTVN
jgi:hypothetical protein